jgi:hypothetical protein
MYYIHWWLFFLVKADYVVIERFTKGKKREEGWVSAALG